MTGKKFFKENFFLIIILVMLILISGCSSKTDVKKALEEIRTGTDGITLSFLQNAPPDMIHVEQGTDESANSFEVVLQLINKGAYPQPGQSSSPKGIVYLSGYDLNIIGFTPKNPPVENLEGKSLEGKSSINPTGGLDLVTFRGVVNANNLNVEKYEPTLLATACYYYQTIAGPSVCIDPDPYSTSNQKKVCQVQDIALTSQGAPVAVIKVGEEAFATKTQFKITIKNVGGGEVIKFESLEKCSPTGEKKVLREDIDKVKLVESKVGTKVLTCGPFINAGDSNIRGEAGDVRMINGEGYIICELPISNYGNTKTAYITPMTIDLRYGYRNSVEKKINIKKEATSAGSPSTPTDTSVQNPYGLPEKTFE